MIMTDKGTQTGGGNATYTIVCVEVDERAHQARALDRDRV
jgi:hypothetical protein